MRDEQFFRSAVHESGHFCAALVLTGTTSHIALKTDGSAICSTKFPPEWPPNDHKFLVYDGLVSAAGLAAEWVILGDGDRVKGRQDVEDLMGTCEQLRDLDPYKAAQLDTLCDLMETSAKALLRPHRKALEFLAGEVYYHHAMRGTDLYAKLTMLFPRYKEGAYTPMLAGSGWQHGWCQVMDEGWALPDPLAGWRSQESIDAKARHWRAVVQRRRSHA